MKPPLRRSRRQSGEGVRPHTMAVPSASTLHSSTKRRGDVHTDASLAATNEALKSSRNRKRKRRDDLDDGETEVDSNPSPDLQAVHKQHLRRQEPLPTSEDTSLEDNYFAVESPDEVQSGSNPIGPDLTKLPPLQPLPISSADLLVPHDAVLDCLAVYTFLRSFSRALFLSPFSLQEFQRAVCSDTPTTLMDSVHVSLLQAVRRHLERLAQEGSEVARGCLRQPDWKFLDTVTWSSHLKGFLVTYGFKKSCDAPFPCLDVEYYKTAVKTKLAILNFLCDHILETAEMRIELDMRQRADGYKIAQESEDSLEAVEERVLPGLHGPAKDSLQVENCNVEPKDTNIDECVLCGMDGNLICCDGCPASYHSRCVGVSKGALPRGDWFCPECRISRSESKFVGLKGADLLGVDPYGRTFMATSGYLLVAESHVRSSVGFTYYNCRDLSILLGWMEKMDPFYHSIKEAVQQHWNPVKGNNSTKMHNDLGSDMLIGEDTIEVLNRRLEIRDYKTGFGPKGRADGKIVKGGLGFCDMCRHDIAEDDELRADGYINHYIQGDVAATAAASVALLRSRQDFSATKNGSLSKKTHVNQQLNAFYKAQPLFYWPNMKKKLMELPKERCGWCFSCKNPIMKRGCLLNQASGVLAAGAAHIPGGVFPTESGSGHLPAVAGYLLHMEENLKSLLLGCWEDANYRTWWQKQVREAACVSDLKIPLLQLESCLRPVILSEKWFSCEEDAPPLTFGSSTAEAALLQSIGYKRKHHSLSIELRSSLYDIAAMTWLQRWKRGKHSKKVFHWYILPMQVARQAGRQGGLKKIQGLFYTEGLEVPKRSRHYAWQAMVEAACTVSQVALQVRCLDACIRWDELLSSTQFNGCEDHVFPENAMIYAKKLDGGVPMFLVDAEGDSGPFNQHESNISKPAMNKDQSYKVWLSEPELPLSILRDFEQRTLILRQENLAGVAVSQKCYRKPLKASKKDVFDKLLLRSGLCCREDVLSSSELRKLKECGSGMHQYRNCQESFHTKSRADTNFCSPSRSNQPCLRFPGRNSGNRLIYTSDFHFEESSNEAVLQKCTATGKCNRQNSGTGTVVTNEGNIQLNEDLSWELQTNVNQVSDQNSEPNAHTDESHMQRKLSPDKISGCCGVLRVGNPQHYPVNMQTVAPQRMVKRNPVARFSKEGIHWRTNKTDVSDFNQKKIIRPGQVSPDSYAGPRCCLCSRNYDADHLYIGCDYCPLWFHGDALEVTVNNVAEVMGFKCHRCRKHKHPECPHTSEKSAFR